MNLFTEELLIQNNILIVCLQSPENEPDAFHEQMSELPENYLPDFLASENHMCPETLSFDLQGTPDR